MQVSQHQSEIDLHLIAQPVFVKKFVQALVSTADAGKEAAQIAFILEALLIEEALQKYPEQSFVQKFGLCNRQKFSGRKIKEGF